MGAQPQEVAPHSFEAEEAVLGALLIEGLPSVKRSMERLSATDFFIEHHRLVYATMVGMAIDDEPIDLITVQEELRRAGDLLSISPAILAILMERGTIAAYLDRYVDIVVVYALRREAIQTAVRLIGSAEGGEDVRDFLSRTIGSLQVIRARVV